MAARSLDAELGTPRPRAAPPLPLHPLAPAPPSPPPSPSSAHAAAPSPPSSAGTWIAPLCDWRSEPVLCGVACCCPCITYSQLAERVFNVPGACATLTITLGILAAGFMCFSLYAAVTTVGRLAFYTKDPEYFQYYFLDLPSEYVATYVAAAVVGATFLIITTALLMRIRQKQRARDGIPHNEISDLCVSMWPCVAPCASVQMLRQEGLGRQNFEPFTSHGGEASIKLMAVVPV